MSFAVVTNKEKYIIHSSPSLPFLAILVSSPPPRLPDSSPCWPLVLILSADRSHAWSVFEDELWGPCLLPTGEWMAVERALRRVLKRDTKDVLFLKLQFQNIKRGNKLVVKTKTMVVSNRIKYTIIFVSWVPFMKLVYT